MSEVKDKEDIPINVGDVVSGKRSGGKQTGEVQAIIALDKDTDKNPPKVVIQDQHGKDAFV